MWKKMENSQLQLKTINQRSDSSTSTNSESQWNVYTLLGGQPKPQNPQTHQYRAELIHVLPFFWKWKFYCSDASQEEKTEGCIVTPRYFFPLNHFYST